MRKISILCSIALLVLSPACNKSTPAGIAQTPTTKSVAADSQVMYYANYAEPEYLDPSLMTDTSSVHIGIQLFEGLTDYNPKDNSPIPGVAERWDLSPDGKVYTFYLRKDAKWSDGTPVTADDFVSTWRRVVNPKTVAKYAYLLYYIKNARPLNEGKVTDFSLLGVKAVNPTTLRVELEAPTPFFPMLLCMPTFRPVKQEVVEKFGDRWTLPEHIVSNGYFKLVEWTPNKQIVLEPNPYYWDRAKVSLSRVHFLPIEDRETALKLFFAGQVHYTPDMPAIKLPQLRDHPEFVDGPNLGTYFLTINTKRPHLKDKRVRQALSMAIDREQIVKLINKGIAHDAFTPKGVAGYHPPPGLGFNPTKAKQLLAEAGYADPKTFPPTTIFYNTSENHKMVMEIVQSMWKQNLGIDVRLQNMEWKTLLKTYETLDYDIGRYGWLGDYSDPNTFVDMHVTGGGNNHTGWGNKRYDELVQLATTTTDNTQRYAYFQEAEAIFLDEQPAVPIYTYTWPTMTSKRLSGFYHNLQDLHPLKLVSLKGDGVGVAQTQ